MTTDSPAPGSSGPIRWQRLTTTLSRIFGRRLPLDNLPVAGVTPARRRRRRRGLHVCAECGADAVIPVDAEPLDEFRWTMLLRCGVCGTTVSKVVSNAEAERYDCDLNRGWNQIRSALERIKREDMAEWTAAFTTALDRDLIDPGDFSGRLSGLS